MADEFFKCFRQVLKPLGLSEYEIRVFLTLVKNGPANYKVLGKKSDVPLGKIYQVLSSLEAKGFVEIIHEKPKIYKAVEPRRALRRRLRRLEDDYYELEWKIREVLPTLQFQYNSKHNGIQGVIDEILVGQNSFASHIRESLLTALDEVLISIYKFDVKQFEEELFKQLLRRGVTIKVICSTVDEKTRATLNRLIDLGLEIRIFDALVDEYYVIDDNFAFTFIGKHGEDICLKVRGLFLCRALRERFEDIWEKARVMRQRMNKPRNRKIRHSHSSNFINSLRFKMLYKPKLS